ncbi:MAG: hypothetical protein KBT03_04730 [Bacteroidales bacterium]|nr:hypothetical protein [Candidatus Scybalousia scybalohippi]
MVNTPYLDSKIKESGKKREYLAEKCGLSRQGFYLKCIGKQIFNADEIKVLCKELYIKDLKEKEKIFFAN